MGWAWLEARGEQRVGGAEGEGDESRPPATCFKFEAATSSHLQTNRNKAPTSRATSTTRAVKSCKGKRIRQTSSPATKGKPDFLFCACTPSGESGASLLGLVFGRVFDSPFAALSTAPPTFKIADRIYLPPASAALVWHLAGLRPAPPPPSSSGSGDGSVDGRALPRAPPVSRWARAPNVQLVHERGCRGVGCSLARGRAAARLAPRCRSARTRGVLAASYVSGTDNQY